MRFTKRLVGSFAALLLAGACTDLGSSNTALSGGDHDHDEAAQDGDCTLTQGYWKNHPDAWPVSSLKLGTLTYSKAELIAILKTPVMGNGLIKLAHQLIAAKLNIAAGADDVEIEATIVAADALIGDLEVGVDRLSSRDVSELNDELDAFNNGDLGPGHCDKNDDDDDDGCDHDDDGDCDHDDDDTCDGDCDHDDDGDCDGGDHEEPAPLCGNGALEAGEECDDGNLDNGDGCSAVCVVESSCPTSCH